MVGPGADAVIRPPYRISGGPLYLGRRLAQAATSATTAFVQFASFWGWALNRLWGSPAAAPTKRVREQPPAEARGQPVPDRGAPADGEAGGGADLVGPGLADLGHI